MTVDIDELERLAKAASPGPWSARVADRPDIWCATHPVAEVIEGKWGETFPTLRLTGEPPHVTAEAYLEQTPQGEVDPAQAVANRRYIAALHPAVLLELLTLLRAAQNPPGWRSRLSEYLSVSLRLKPAAEPLRLEDQSNVR